MSDTDELRAALAEVRFYKAGGFSYNAQDFQIAANPARIARLLDRLEAAEKDAQRYHELRNNSTPDDWARIAVLPPGEMDAAIDAAMQSEQA